VARYNLAEVQLRLERDDEALENLRRFLDEAPESPYAPRARQLLEEPRRARVPMMPEFEAETLEGEQIDSAQLAGKVVLFDFWATWCAPCRQSVPTLRRLHRRAAKKGDPFVIVGVPGDDGFSPVRHYVEQEHIEWPQIWDESHVLAGRLFQVRGLPTYVLVDHEGMILFRASGWNRGIATELRRQVAKAVDAARRADGDR
jgi:thiol-disulfide isomerase/thioredoxin